MKYLASVSRNLSPTNRAWDSVVHQAGLPILDSELNLAQELKIGGRSGPSGVFVQDPRDVPAPSFRDVSDPSFVVNSFEVGYFIVNVAGMMIIVSGTNSTDPLSNRIELPAPSASLGSAPDIKRTDFVFLEVWRAEVTPSSPTRNTYLINGAMQAGAVLTIDTTPIAGNLVTLTEGVDFSIGLTNTETARNVADAINSAVFGAVTVSAETRGTDRIFVQIEGDDGSSVITVPVGMLLQDAYVGTSGENKPDPLKVWYLGNTQSDSSLWFDDDIVDPAVNRSTSRRVQIQYRIRSYAVDFDGATLLDGIDPKTQFYGFDNPGVLAQGAESAPVVGYGFNRADGSNNLLFDSHGIVEDSGLFYAGDGTQTSANDLGTVDGYVYAIPLFYVSRRNEGAFSPTTGANNGPLTSHAGYVNSSLTSNLNITIGAGLSDRPDGLFADQISEVDVLDLRRVVVLGGAPVNYDTERTRQFQLLLDNQNKTWMMDGSDLHQIAGGSGDQSVSPMVCDEIGRPVALGGSGNTTGRGNYVANFDHVRSRFSSHPVIERITMGILSAQGGLEYPIALNTPQFLTVQSDPIAYPPPIFVQGFHHTAGWYEGDIITIDLTLMDTSASSKEWKDSSSVNPIAWTDVIPTGTKIIGVEGFHNVGHTGGAISQEARFKSVQGLGTSTITIILDRNRTVHEHLGVESVIVGDAVMGAVAPETYLYLTLIVEYPASNGISASVSEIPAPEGTVFLPDGGMPNPLLINDFDQIPPYIIGTYPMVHYREGVKEALVEYVGGIDNGWHNVLPGINVPSGSLPGALLLTEGRTILEDYWSYDQQSVIIPYKVHYDPNNANFNPVVRLAGTANYLILDDANSTYGESFTILRFQALLPTAQTLLDVAVYTRDPLPNYGASGLQASLYYRRRAPQTCGSKSGATSAPSSLTVRVVSVGDRIEMFQYGAGSSSQGYPYASPNEQLGVNPAITGFTSEDVIQGSLSASIQDFTVNTGALSLPALVSMDITLDLEIGGQGNSPVLDVEGRTIYPMIGSTYLPGIFAQSLSSYVLHKNALPILVKVLENSIMFRKGEILLVVLTRLSGISGDVGIDPTPENQVTLSSTDLRTSVCVYRTQGNLLIGEN